MKRTLLVLAATLCVAVAETTPSTPPSNTPGQSGEHRGMPTVEERLQRLSEKLSLTDDQKTKIKPILVDEHAQMKALHEDQSTPREQKMEKMHSIRQASREKIRATLTADQQKKFDEMKEHFRKQGPPQQ